MLNYLSPSIRNIIVQSNLSSQLEEIRLRLMRPLVVKTHTRHVFLNRSGKEVPARDAYDVNNDDINNTVQIITKNSWYAWEDEIRGGYLTLPGGHRVGVGGRAVLDNGGLRTVKHISSLNFRKARQVLGAADSIFPQVCPIHRSQVCSVLIISPPGCGKTTLLRDLTRQIANHDFQVVVVDERSEIAACFNGVPQLDVGMQTDVLDGYPKAIGINHAVRALGPNVVVTDEIGHPEDAFALAELARCGVKVIASCHGESLTQIKTKAWAKQTLGVFEIAVILSRRAGPGTIEKVITLPR